MDDALSETSVDIDRLEESEVDRLYGTPGEILLERMEPLILLQARLIR